VNAVGLAADQVYYEQLAFWRNPLRAVFTFAFPLMFLVVFGSLNRTTHVASLGGLPYDQYYVPAIVAYGVMSSCYANLAIGLTTRRASGVLKRMRGTPLPAWGAFAGLLGSSLVVAAVLSAIVSAVGVVAYHVTFPGHWPALAVALGAGVACFCALGVAVSCLVSDPEAAPPVVNIVFFALLFVSGTFFPLTPGSALARLAGYFPVRPFTELVFRAFDPALGTGPSHGFDGPDLARVALWTAVATVVAVRRWQWAPAR
jgi:ABC-2 type transport system permease protein